MNTVISSISLFASAAIGLATSIAVASENAAFFEKKVHVHDFHATILHLLGLDHTRLTYCHAGRDYRLTDVHGEVVKEILA